MNCDIDLNNIVIERCKRQDLSANLNILKNFNIDPFNEGFDFTIKSVNFVQFRLCVTIFSNNNILSMPIVSDIFGEFNNEAGLKINTFQNLRMVIYL